MTAKECVIRSVAFQKKKPSLEEARAKIRTFCNYRERSHREVKQKLYDMGLYKREVEELLLAMMDEGLLNEERYACGFARGHFYQKKWGWRKIEAALRAQGTHANLLAIARKEIDPDDYRQVARSLAGKKWDEHRSDQYLTRKGKVYRYLIGKGYESTLVNEVIAGITAGKNK